MLNNVAEFEILQASFVADYWNRLFNESSIIINFIFLLEHETENG